MTAHRLLHKVLVLLALLLPLRPGIALAQGPAAQLQPVAIEGPSGSVSAWKLNVRSGPGTSYPILTTVSYREILALTGRTYDSSWLQIQRPEGVQGWVSARYMLVSGAHLSAVPIIDVTDPTPEPWPSEFTGYVTAYRLNVRSGPGISYAIIAKLREGQTVTLIGRDPSANWLQMKQWDGSQGWVSARYINGTFMAEALPITGGAVPSPVPGATATITAWKLNVRSGPGIAFGIKAWVYRGQQVQLLGRDSSSAWLKASIGNGLVGWVSAAYAATNTPIASLPVVD